MEDISRELEKEIAQSKPAPLKHSQKKRILIVDEFGGIKSGGYFKPLTLSLLAVVALQLLVSVVMFQRYSGLSRDNEFLSAEVLQLKEKSSRLLDEKEVLMARLMLLGKEPEPIAAVKAESPLKTPTTKKKLRKDSGIKRTAVVIGQKPSLADTQSVEKAGASSSPLEKVTIEKFTISQRAGEKRVKVRFEIYNKTKSDVDISGRIFVVLKPNGAPEKEWAPLPFVKLSNGVPVQYRKGQYFSISRFKPVHFKLDKPKASIIYTDAVVYIYNDGGQLIYNKSIQLPEGEQN